MIVRFRITSMYPVSSSPIASSHTCHFIPCPGSYHPGLRGSVVKPDADLVLCLQLRHRPYRLLVLRDISEAAHQLRRRGQPVQAFRQDRRPLFRLLILSLHGQADGSVQLCILSFRLLRALPQPAMRMATAFTRYLRSHGITVSGEPDVHFTMPKQYRKLYTDTAFNLFTTTALTTQTNNNIASESLFKLLGYLRDGHGTFGSGRRFMYDYFQELDLSTSGVNMVDGSGLSRDNRVTAYFVCQFLDAVARQQFFFDYAGALGISNRVPEYDIIPRVQEDCSLRIKSGVAPGVRNFAGYFTNQEDQVFSFSILCNNYSCDDATIDQLIKGIIEEIIRL